MPDGYLINFGLPKGLWDSTRPIDCATIHFALTASRSKLYTKMGRVFWTINGHTMTYTNSELRINKWPSQLLSLAIIGAALISAVGNIDNSSFVQINPFGGRASFDESRIHNRALSSFEVSQLYNRAPGPVGYWKLNEGTGTVIHDSSGYGHTGSLVNSSNGYGQMGWGIGKYGSGIANVGSIPQWDQSYINITGSPADFQFAYNSQFTVEAWFYATSTSPVGYQAIFAQPSSPNRFFYELSQNGDGTICGAVGKGYVGANVACKAITLNTWTHAAAVYDGANTRLYINGSFVASTAYTFGSLGNPDEPTYLGNDFNDITSRAWPGSFDEVKVYNYARTQKRIVQDMNPRHTAPGSPVGSQLISGHWTSKPAAALERSTMP